MKVSLLSYTEDPLRVLYAAYRTCYSARAPDDLFEQELTSSSLKFLDERIRSAHTSPLRHIHFTFGISGITRVCSHQLVRHTVGVAHSMQSQRYVKQKGSLVEQIVATAAPKLLVEEMASAVALEDAGRAYQLLLESGAAAEDARYVLPGATPTNLVTTFSYEALLHFCSQRLCHRAQAEIRELAGQMAATVRVTVPFLAAYLGPPCCTRPGMCLESLHDYSHCPAAGTVPHRDLLIKLWSSSCADTNPEAESQHCHPGGPCPGTSRQGGV